MGLLDPSLWEPEVYQERLKACWEVLLRVDPHAPVAIPLGLVLGFVSTLIFFPLLQRLTPILMRWKRLHYLPLSDIPGIPDHYDYAFISALCTLPDPHNFVGVYSNVTCTSGVRFRMRMPLCRYWSVALYPGMFDPAQDVTPASIADSEMVLDEDGSFEVIISEEKPPGCKNWLAAQGIKDGLLVFRRYAVPEGVRVDYPAFYGLGDDTLLKPSYSITCGAMTTERVWQHRYHRLMAVIRLSVVVYTSLLLAGWSAMATNVVVAVSSLTVVGVNHLLYFAGRRKAKRMLLDKVKDRVHEAIEPAELDYGNKGARPHPGHKYYVFVYDTRRGGDILIKGTILKGRQKMWTLVIYDPEGIPLPQYYNDRTIIPAKETSDKIHYEVVLTQGDVQVPRCAGGNNISVASSPWGVGLVRVIFPDEEGVFTASKPTIEIINKKTA